MKKIYFYLNPNKVIGIGFLLLLPGLAVSGFAQRKSEFGFLVKAGNYTFPSQKTEHSYVYSSSASTNTLTIQPGAVYSLGFWQAIRLSDHFRLSGELLYRFSSFSGRKQEFNVFPDGNYRLDERRKFDERSLSLPIKLHYSWNKDGKLSLALGGGISRFLSSRVFIRSTARSFQLVEKITEINSNYANPIHQKNSYNLCASLNYRLDPNTTLGFEYTFEKAPRFSYPDIYFIIDPISDLIFYLPEPSAYPAMKSFSVSLKHNIRNGYSKNNL